MVGEVGLLGVGSRSSSGILVVHLGSLTHLTEESVFLDVKQQPGEVQEPALMDCSVLNTSLLQVDITESLTVIGVYHSWCTFLA